MILTIVQEGVPDVFMVTGPNLTRFNFLYLQNIPKNFFQEWLNL